MSRGFWFFGSALFGRPRISGSWEVLLPLRSTTRPLGFAAEDPELCGSNTVDHTKGDASPIGVQLIRWKCKADHDEVPAVILDDPKAVDSDSRSTVLGVAELLKERAVRKETQRGGEVVEYQWELLLQVAEDDEEVKTDETRHS